MLVAAVGDYIVGVGAQGTDGKTHQEVLALLDVNLGEVDEISLFFWSPQQAARHRRNSSAETTPRRQEAHLLVFETAYRLPALTPAKVTNRAVEQGWVWEAHRENHPTLGVPVRAPDMVVLDIPGLVRSASTPPPEPAPYRQEHLHPELELNMNPLVSAERRAVCTGFVEDDVGDEV